MLSVANKKKVAPNKKSRATDTNKKESCPRQKSLAIKIKKYTHTQVALTGLRR